MQLFTGSLHNLVEIRSYKTHAFQAYTVLDIDGRHAKHASSPKNLVKFRVERILIQMGLSF
ncbi:MAG: hypothetical protein QF872_08920, partial [Gammaproteobacteria bacterium]|nr:hypothetical protein [Gammaproteobacteria bacterium]